MGRHQLDDATIALVCRMLAVARADSRRRVTAGGEPIPMRLQWKRGADIVSGAARAQLLEVMVERDLVRTRPVERAGAGFGDRGDVLVVEYDGLTLAGQRLGL